MVAAGGYKKTEVGVVPADWRVLPLGAISDTSSGTTPPRSLYSRYFKNGVFAWVKTLDLNNSRICSTDEFVTQAALEETSLRCYPPGTVLVAMYGGFNQIGRTGILGIPATVNQAITAINVDRRYLRPEYLLHYLNFRIGHWRSVASSSRRDPNITGSDVDSFPIAFPSIEEQETIVSALADIDALLESLDRLLAKKRDIKQAAMQQLLSGRIRLPGFNDQWTTAEFGEVVAIRDSRVAVSHDLRDAPCVELECIGEANGQLLKTVVPRTGSVKFAFRREDVLFGRLRAYLRKYWFASFDGLCSTEIWPLIPVDAGVSSRFLYFLVQTESFVDSASQAYGTHMPRTDWSVVSRLSLLLPKLAEQEAISSVILDMDVEVSLLQAQIRKLRDVRIAMIQALLTGNTRLIARELANA